MHSNEIMLKMLTVPVIDYRYLAFILMPTNTFKQISNETMLKNVSCKRLLKFGIYFYCTLKY